MTATAAWTVSGSGSKVVIETGGKIVTGAFSHTLTLDMQSGAEYSVSHTAYGSVTVGTWDNDSTVRFTHNGVTFRTINHPNVIIDFTGTKSAAITFTVLGDFTKQNTGTFNIASTATAGTLNIGGALIVNGGIFSTGDNAGTLNFTNTGKAAGNITLTSGTLTLGTGTAADPININSGRTVGLGSNISIGSGSTLTVNGRLNCGTNVISGAGSVAVNGELGIGSTNTTDALAANVTASFTLNAGSTVNFNGGAGQGIGARNYHNLTFSDNAKTLASSGIIGIAGTFTPGTSTSHTINFSTIEYNGTSAQTLPSGFNPYENLRLNNTAGTAGFTGLKVNDTLTVQSGTFTSASDYHHVVINGTLALSGNITVSGNWTNNGTFTHNGFSVTFDGDAASQTIGGTNSTTFAALQVSNTGPVNNNIVSLDGSLGATNVSATSLSITNGVFAQGTGGSSANFSTTGSATVVNITNGTWQNFGTGDLTLSGDVSNAGTINFNGNGTGCNELATNDISISSSGGPHTWSGTGTFSMTDVTVANQSSGAPQPPITILVNSGTDAGGNTGWTFVDQCAAGTYTWIGGTIGANTDWQVGTNWNPTRATPAAGDVLIFDGSATPAPTVTNVPTQTISSLQLKNNVSPASLNASAVGSPHTLTITGDGGLSVASDSRLELAGSNGLTIAVTTGSGSTINGHIQLKGGPHRLTGANAGQITFASGAIFTAGTTSPASGFSGHPFGQGTNDSVRFQDGSNAFFNEGDDPFGGTGKTIVTFSPGSTQQFSTSTAWAAEGRTYGNLTLAGASQTYFDSTASNEVTVTGNLSIASSNTLKLSDTAGGDLNLLGNFTDDGTFDPNSRTVKFTGGSATQTVFKNGAAEGFFNLLIDKSGGAVLMLNDVTINGALEFDGSPGSAVDVLDINSNFLTLNGTVGSVPDANSGLKGNLNGSVLIITGTGALGTVNFVSGGQEITSLQLNRSTTVPFGTNLTIGQPSGSPSGSLDLVNGIMDMGVNTLTLNPNVSNGRTNGYVSGNLKRVFAANSTFTFHVGTANGYSPVAVNVTGNTFPSSLAVKAVEGQHPNITGTNALQRYWTLTETGELTADLTFNWRGGAPPGGDVVGTESDYKIFKYTGSFEQIEPDVLDTTNHFATKNGVSAFSDWTLAEAAAVEEGTLQFSAANFNDNETNADHTATITVSRTGGTDGAVSVQWATSANTATAATDYIEGSGALNWADGEGGDKTFTVTVKGDTEFEPDELVNLTLSSPTGGATIGGTNPATLTIQNDDPPPCVPPGTVYVDDDWAAATLGTDPDGAGPATNFGCDSFATIQGGVDGVTANGTVIVRAGTYSERVTVNKTVTLQGAQAGVDARTGRVGAPESIVNGTIISGTKSTSFLVTANNVTIDGFTVQEQVNSINNGAGIVLGAATSGTQVVNNIIRDNVVGMFLANASGGNQAVISQNLFRDNDNTGPSNGNGIYTDAAVNGGLATNILIENNRFDGANFTRGLNLQVVTNATITGNTFAEGNAVNFGNVDNSTLSNNTFSGVMPGAFGNVIGVFITSVSGNGCDNLTVTGNSFTTRLASAISAVGATDLLVTNNTITQDVSVFAVNTNRYMVSFNGLRGTGNNFGGNTITLTGITPSGAGVNAVSVSGNFTNTVALSGNVINGGNADTAAGSNNSHGIGISPSGLGLPSTPTPVFSTVNITNNVVTGFIDGVSFDSGFGPQPLNARTNVAINGNDLSGNSAKSIRAADSGTTINASVNWFGSATFAAVQALITGTAVDYTPYLNVGTDTAATAGFQGDFSSLTVHTAGSQFGTTARIQEGIGYVTAGGTVKVLTGTYAGDVDATAKSVNLAAGASPGQVTINGNFTLNSDDTLPIEIDGVSAATQYDNFIVNGAVALGGATLVISGTYAPAASDSFTLINNDASDAVVGIFNGLAEGTLVNVNGTNKKITYVGGDGNDVVLGALNADLTLTKSDSQDPVTEGNALTYTLTVSNAGPDAATNVVLTDTLPVSVTFVSATPSQGAPCTGTATITCNLGTISNSSNATVQIVVIPNTPGTITNSASVTAFENDATPATDSEDTLVIAAVCAALPANMLAWYPGDGNAHDIKGPTFENGTLQGGATFAAGKVNQGFSFDGSNDYVETADFVDLNNSGDEITIEGWIKRNASGSGGMGIASKYVNATDSGWFFRFYDDKLNWGTVNAGVYSQWSSSATFTDTTSFHHVAVVWKAGDGSSLHVYVDGVEVPGTFIAGNGTQIPPNTSQNVLIGTLIPGADVMNGVIDELGIYNRALAQAEIAAIYNASFAGKCRECTTPPAAMVSWWPFDETGGTTVSDIAGPNDGGTVSGATFTTGKVGNALNFNGTSDNVVIPSSPSLNSTTNALTVDAWVYWRGHLSPSDTVDRIHGKRLGAGNVSHHLVIVNNILHFGVNIGVAGGDNAVDPNPFPTNRWVHVTGTYDGTTVRLFKDGVEVASNTLTTGPIQFDNGALAIGWYDNTFPDHWNGLIDEFEIFNSVLSPTQIAALANAGNAGKCHTTGVTVDVSPASVAEDGAGNLVYTFRRSGDITTAVTVNFSVGGTASSASDYTQTGATTYDTPSGEGTIEFLANEGAKTVTIDPTPDTSVESNETVLLTVTSGTGYVVGSPDNATGTITNDDATLTLVKTVVNNNGGTKVVSDFPLFIDGNSVTSGTPTTVSANVVHTASETTQTGYLASVWGGDCNADGTITLQPGDNKTCTITNDDVAPTLTLVKTVVNDNGGSKVVSDFPLFINGNSVTSGNPNTLSANVLYTATETAQTGYAPSAWGGDCAADGTITLQPGDNKTCTITNDDVAPTLTLVKTVVNDSGGSKGVSDFPLFINGNSVTSGNPNTLSANTLYTASETTQIGYAASAWGGDCAADGTITLQPGDNKTCTITNDDVLPAISIDDVTHLEGDAGTTDYNFTVSLSHPSTLTTTVNAQTADGTATTADSDYVGVGSTPLTFGPNVTTQEFHVTVNGDTKFSINETFFVNLSSPGNATISDNQGIGTLTNDDASPTLSIGNAARFEGTTVGTTTSFDFTVTKSGNASEVDATVNYATAPGTASENPTAACSGTFDYQFKSGSVTFTPLETSPKTITILVCKDSTFEADETFFVNLSGETNVTVTDNQGLGTIANDDAAPPLSPVNTTDDANDGSCDATHCSLREAINAANASAGDVSIVFAIPANDPRHFYYTDDGVAGQVSLANITTTTAANDSGLVTPDPDWAHSWWSILPTSALPTLNSTAVGATIDGYSQSGASPDTAAAGHNAILKIELNGSGIPGGVAHGLTIGSGSNTVSGLIINRFLGTGGAGTGNGVGMTSSSDALKGNFIGTDPSGTIDVGNAGSGVLATVSNVNIGGANVGDANLISGNDGSGIVISGNSVVVQGNYIGTKADGTSALGNTLNGVALGGGGAVFNTIGGTLAGEANLIAFSGQDGVNAVGGFSNTIRGNSIFSNGATSADLGIDLSADGLTANDSLDPDSGPNNLQNFPIIRAALAGTPNRMRGTLNSQPNQTYTIDVYASPSCDTSGNGEGKQFLGSTTANSGANGDALWSLNPTTLNAGDFITATATDASGNTSEFSACFQATALNTGTVQFVNAPYTDSETNADHTVTVTVSRTGGSNLAVDVTYATSDGTATAGEDYVAASGTLHWNNGETGDKTFNITVKGDTIFEGDETVNITLSGATISGANPTTLTITNDDPQPSLSINDVSLAEGNGGTTSFVFTVTKTNVGPVSVNYQTQNGTATIGTGDYQTGSGSVTFGVFETQKMITVLVNGETAPELNESFSVVLSGATGATISDNTGVGTILNDDESVSAGQLIISEFRLSGPGGANDEFIELYNSTDQDLLVTTTDGSDGWAVATSNGVEVFHIANGITIPARGHFLGTNISGYSLNTYPAGNGTFATGNATWTSDVPDNSALAVFRTNNAANFNTTNRLDSVGPNTESNTLYREGAGYSPLAPANLAQNLEHTFFRQICVFQADCPTPGRPRDTQDNAADFIFADTTGALTSAGQRLGSPGPENLASPIKRDSAVNLLLLDANVGEDSAPNHERNSTSDSANASQFGTLTIRRRVVNQTGVTVTRLRFRVIDMTTHPSGIFADLRLRSSSNQVISGINDPNTCSSTGAPTTPSCTVNVIGLTLEQPPAVSAANGGGMNTTVTVVLPNGGLPHGQSINVNFLLGVQNTGQFRFYLVIEALP